MIRTSVVTGAETHPFIVAVTVYKPLMALVVFVTIGFCRLLVKPPGPVHEYVAPVIEEEEVKFNVLPEHKGPLLFAIKPDGADGLTNVNGPAGFEVHPFNVAVIVE